MPPAPRIAAVLAVLAALALAASGSSCGSSASGKHPTVAVHVGGATVEAEVAAGTKARERGLGGRRSLAEGRGMLFVYSDRLTRTYWMKGMRFPIDIIWIDRGRVTGVERNVPVPQGYLPLYYSGGPADRVLEVPAGWAGRHGTKRGDRVVIEKTRSL
jgi:uncharacterized membrane protein (UPF0127 family)